MPILVAAITKQRNVGWGGMGRSGVGEDGVDLPVSNSRVQALPHSGKKWTHKASA